MFKAANDQTSDAIGRAYSAGILPLAQEDDLLAKARRLQSLYVPVIRSVQTAVIHLGRLSGGRGDYLNENPHEEEFNAARRRISLVHPGAWDAVYDLVLGQYPDEGPIWLDRLVEAKHKAETCEANAVGSEGYFTAYPRILVGRADDKARLAMAIRGLSAM